jgi:hypothetical protein
MITTTAAQMATISAMAMAITMMRRRSMLQNTTSTFKNYIWRLGMVETDITAFVMMRFCGKFMSDLSVWPDTRAFCPVGQSVEMEDCPFGDVSDSAVPSEPENVAELLEASAPTGAELNAEQWQAYNKILNGESVHICGAAGTGKSLLLMHVVRALRKLNLAVALTASTGVAANNLNQGNGEISATTLHWWMGSICEESISEEVHRISRGRAKTRWMHTDVLIIDEISMISPILLDKVDGIARGLRESDVPFGGLQVLLVHVHQS